MTIVISKAIYDHLEAFGIFLKPLFYVKFNSEHILLNKVSSQMPLNGRKWPRNAAGTIAQIKVDGNTLCPGSSTKT